MEKEVINLEEAVALLKTSKPTFYRWIKDGKVKGFKVGREWRFYKSDLTDFVESTDREKEQLKKELQKAIDFYDDRLKEKSLSPDS